MMFKLDEPKAFADAIAIASELVHEVRMKIDKAGLSIIAIDPANVALVMLKMPASAFSQFNTEESEQLGINLDDLKAVLRRCNVGSSLTAEKEENTLKLTIMDKIKRNFNLALLDIEGEEKIMPQLDFTTKIELDSSEFAQAIEDAAIVSDAAAFISGENFIIEARGNLNSSRTEFGNECVKKTSEKGDKAKYSLEYLQKFAKAGRLADKVIMQFSNDYPLRLDFKTTQLDLGFILAPRVEEE